MKSYEEAFAKIREATQILDIDRLVDRFIEVEDQNFSLFNYVNELNNEIEHLQEKVMLSAPHQHATDTCTPDIRNQERH